MQHPFFDNRAYPWKRADAKELHETLMDAVPDVDGIVRLYQRAGGPLEELTRPQAPRGLWHDALDWLAKVDGLRGLCDDIAGDPVFAHNAAVQRAVHAVINARSHAERQLVGKEHVLVLNRQRLRSNLAEIARDGSERRVLIIRGDQKTGKSRAQFVFRELAKERGAAWVYLGAGLVSTVEEMLLRLFTEVTDEDPDLTRLTTETASYRVMCARLRKCAERSGTPVYVAVDDLGPGPDGTPLLDEEIRRFSETLATMCLDAGFGEWFRVLLIHYPAGKVPSEWKPGLWLEDTTAEDDITPDDVGAFLSAWAAQQGLKLRDPDRNAEVQAIFERADLPDPDRPRLERLHDAVHESLARLASGAAAPIGARA